MRLLVLKFLQLLSVASSLRICPRIVDLLLKQHFIALSLSKVYEVSLLPAFDNVFVVECVLEDPLLEEVEFSCPVIGLVVCELRELRPLWDDLHALVVLHIRLWCECSHRELTLVCHECVAE